MANPMAQAEFGCALDIHACWASRPVVALNLTFCCTLHIILHIDIYIDMYIYIEIYVFMINSYHISLSIHAEYSQILYLFLRTYYDPPKVPKLHML